MLASVAASLTATAGAVATAATSAAEPTGFAGVITTVVPGIIASALPSAVTMTIPVTATIVRVPALYELTAAFVGGLSGATRAVEKRMDVSGVVVLAVVTGIGGGMIRDVLCNETPQVLKPGTLSGTAAALGSTLDVLLVTWMNIVKPIAPLMAVVVTVALRILSVKRGWTAPQPVDYTAVPGRFWGVTRGIFSERGKRRAEEPARDEPDADRDSRP